MQMSEIVSFFQLQSNRLFTIRTPLEGGSDLVLVDFECSEGLSQNFEIRIHLASQNPNIELKRLIGQAATITLQLNDALASSDERYFHGYVTSFSHLDNDGGFTLYHATIQPWLWMLSRRRDVRIFQEVNTETILANVFKEYGQVASFEFRLSKPTKHRSYCTQYRESDLEFVQRLMQEDGLYFFFEHAKDGHTLIISDHSVSAKPIDGRYSRLQYSKGEALDDMAVVTSFQASRQLESGSVGLKTFDYKVPHARRFVSGGTGTNQGEVPAYEIYDYLGEYGFPDGDRGEELVRFRTEALAAHSKIFIGATTSRRLTPCRYFELFDHYDYDSAKPEDRQFLVVTVTHRGTNNYQAGDGAATYHCSFTCIRKKIPYRPAFTIERPSIIGPQTAIVVGPDGEEIYTDSLGRVKVQFHWDRIGKRNQGSSCWVRVGQPWAGRGFGMVQVPRIGDEVVVIFLDGDPDRPLIISSVYNSANMPPWALPANATQSGILSRSTKGGNAHTANAIRIEDKRGAEEIWIHAEKDQRIEVEHDESLTVGHDRSKSVGNNEHDRIGQNWTLSTGGYKFETVALASVNSVGLGAMLNVGMAYNVNVGGLYLRNIAMEMASTVGLNRTDRVVQNWAADVGHTYTVTVRGKAVGDAVKSDQQNPIEATPDFAPQLPEPVSSSNANQLRITDAGESSLSGAKKTQLVGPGGTVTIDEAGIHLKGSAIFLQAPTISMTDGDASGLVPVTEADCAECAKKTTSAYPVDLATGQKVLAHQDFILPGRLPIDWTRSYRSADQRTGSLGIAWKLPYATEVRLAKAGLVYFDTDGRQLQFPELVAGAEHFHPIEKITLSRIEDDCVGAVYVMRFTDGYEEHYARHPVFEDRWQLHRIGTRDGQSLNLRYTPLGWLCEVSNDQHTVRCNLDEVGRIVSVLHVQDSNRSGCRLAAYEYDEHGDMVEAIDRLDLAWRYAYKHHLLTMYRTPSGAIHVSEWDNDTSQARCSRTYAYTEDSSGRRLVTRDMRFAYSPSLRSTRVTDGLGNTTEYRYNGLWAVDRIVYPDGSIEETHFDETGSLAGYTDALGRKTRIVNDARGNPTTIVDPAGHITRIVFGALNQPELITDPAGQTWVRAYDASGHLLSETDPLGNVTAYTYENGLPVTRTDALGNVTKMQWDPMGQLVSHTDCSGNTTAYTYDLFGQLSEVTDALGNVTRLAHSEAARIADVKPAGMGSWKVHYDMAGRIVAQTDPLDRLTRTEWDAYDQRVKIVDPTNAERRFDYDEFGRLTKLTNANGDVATFRYDSRSRLIEQVGFDGRRQTCKYNAAGDLVERIDHGQDGQITTNIVYDGVGRPIEQKCSDGSHTSYRYDVRGQLTQAQANGPGRSPIQVTYEYDAAGRCTAEVQSHHGRVWRLVHDIDAIGNRASTYVPDAGALVWQRYGSGHVHGVLLNQQPLASFERDALHREVRRTQGAVSHDFVFGDNGLLAVHLWRNTGDLLRSQEDSRPWRTWQYDSAGQLTGLDDALRGNRVYQYDALMHLKNVMSPSGVEAFHYDRAGNLIAELGTLSISSGHANGDRLNEFRSSAFPDRRAEYAYDGHGNRVSRTMLPAVPIEQRDGGRDQCRSGGLLETLRALRRESPSTRENASSVSPDVTRYRYDGNHQMVVVEHADGQRTEYEYDALGRRVAKHRTRSDGASQTTLFVWDGDWMLQEIFAGSTKLEDKVVTYVRHPDHSGPLSRYADGRAWHYVTDHLGTPQELYDDRKEIVWAADLSAYGCVRREIASSVDNPIRFPGQYYDAESGLHYNRFRYYDPASGRYVSQDPIGFLGGYNKYAYALNVPNQAYDPKGLFIPLIVLAGLGARALLGGAIELGMQGGKQILSQVKENWADGRSLTDVNLDCVKIDWADVGVSAAVGTVAPGLFGTAKNVFKSAKAIKVLSRQTGMTANRAAKLQARVSAKRSAIGKELAVQGAWQGIKQGGKCVLGEERKCEE
ncbi:type VI secretion system tip protein VgrG [Burkholderia cepacia]|uniref:type VI secretion system tip protein TssI/VgrG n=2 Tax=Burkholderia cepacia TaxID=292 RepID=UPI0009C0F898|nr:type VI secretion system tip protein TssI/VgrG [Burkholderia cepacia]MCA7996147.1 type VI secretion system tip protein VgrG [Burkholderia cepacia]